MNNHAKTQDNQVSNTSL